ncbi:MAG: hypothetical protein A3G28_01055 [Betaproteobacteria bacterium RIFCSPLOWO2_12_FULL_68_19]|nr:MAG: hypothetical protein A3G28_01055 [Betaproteobacteria bacterium RIFCSPLOWO2_12_FULL_68_19]
MAPQARGHRRSERTETADPLKALKTITIAVYALQAAGFLLPPIVWVVAVIINYVKKEEAAGTWLESHFRWQIRTFWFGLLWGVIGAILLLVIVGWFVLMADAIWIIYRVVKGWLNLAGNRPMPA